MTENGVLRGLVFWILTSQLLCVCDCVCAIFLAKCNDCTDGRLIGAHARVALCVCMTFLCFVGGGVGGMDAGVDIYAQ